MPNNVLPFSFEPRIRAYNHTLPRPIRIPCWLSLAARPPLAAVGAVSAMLVSRCTASYA